MSKAIGILIVIIAIYGGWKVFELWDSYDTARDLKEKEAAAAKLIPDQLPGMPYELNQTYQLAKNNGAAGLGKWLHAYSNQIEDPRRAWIELDYMVMISRDEPVEAKRIFASVKDRTPTNSPIYPRIKLLEKAYQ